jgi:hypothetical protein
LLTIVILFDLADPRIHGTVRDEVGLPIAGAEIVIHSSGRERHLRSQHDGSFTTTAQAGRISLTARMPGFLPVDTTVSASRDDDIEFNPVLARLSTLDTVVTSALPAECKAATTITGFNCRRLNTKGIFLDRLEIQRMKPVYLADVFWDMPGLVIEPTRNGRRVRNEYGWGCIQYLVDGRPPVGRLPEANDLKAVEVYTKYSDVPSPYKTFSWNPPGRVRAPIPCVIINLWTM